MACSKEILLGVTGSIAAYKACEIIRRLQDAHCQSTVIVTEEAKEFVSSLTFSMISGRRVYCGMFDAGKDAWDENHIALIRRAELLLIAPATANIIGKIAGGIADDLLSCVAMAVETKIIIAPAMNNNMYNNRIVQENISKLKRNGIEFVSPEKGKLACGAFGEGHLADVNKIVKATLKALK